MDESVIRLGRALLVAALGVFATGGCHGATAGGRPVDAGQDLQAETTGKLDRDAGCPADAMGGGNCPLNFCGQVKSVASLALGEVASTGADALCTPPYACVPDTATAGGNALQLRCVMPLAGAAAFGAACVKSATGGADAGATSARCRDDALCIDPPSGGTGGPFCTTLCRNDDDCPADAYCLEYPSEPLPNGSYAQVGKCTPDGRIGAAPCTREGVCGANQGCRLVGERTRLATCQAAAGTKSVGAACTAAAECRSGECYDRDGNPGAAGRRSFCAAVCAKNGDCGANQRCVRRVLANNATLDDPSDDVVAGFCRTLAVPTAAATCGVATDCVARADGSDTCDVATGVCYKAGVPPGAPCASDAACDLGASCATGIPYAGGYCRASGCALGATAGLDACPGARSACSQRASDRPVHVCYETCAQPSDCSRFGAGYGCTAPQPGSGEASICIVQ